MTAPANTSRNIIPLFCEAELVDRERLAYDMLFRWLLDLNMQCGSFDQLTFAKNRRRVLAHAVTGRFFGAVAVPGTLDLSPAWSAVSLTIVGVLLSSVVSEPLRCCLTSTTFAGCVDYSCRFSSCSRPRCWATPVR